MSWGPGLTQTHPSSRPFMIVICTRLAIVGMSTRAHPTNVRQSKPSMRSAARGFKACKSISLLSDVLQKFPSHLAMRVAGKPSTELLLQKTKGLRKYTKMKVKTELMKTSYVSSGIVTYSGRPMRHLPSTAETSDIAYMNPQTAMDPKPTAIKRLLAIQSQSLKRLSLGARIACALSTRNKYLYMSA